MATIKDLPEPMLQRVLQQACVTHPQTLLNSACVDKWFSAQLRQPSADILWQAVWSNWKKTRPAAAAEEQKADSALSLKPKDLLRLAGFEGCMLCGAKGSTVYWEFSTRCCKDCRRVQEMPDYHLEKDFGLMPACFQHLPHLRICGYNCTNKSFWKAHLLPILRQQHGADSFQAYMQQQNFATQQQLEQQAWEKQLQARIRRVWKRRKQTHLQSNSPDSMQAALVSDCCKDATSFQAQRCNEAKKHSWASDLHTVVLAYYFWRATRRVVEMTQRLHGPHKLAHWKLTLLLFYAAGALTAHTPGHADRCLSAANKPQNCLVIKDLKAKSGCLHVK